MKTKIIESAGYISIALILALTLVLSFSVVEFNSGVTAQAAAPSENTLNIYPGSISILTPDFDYESAVIFEIIDGEVHYPSVVTYLTLDYDHIINNPDALYQFVFYVDLVSDGEDTSFYLDDITLSNSMFGVANDRGFGDLYFVYSFFFANDGSAEVDFFQLLEDYGVTYRRVCLYDIRLIGPSESNSTADSFFSIIGNGISFGFEAIADGITYTVENLFFVDGSLSDFSIIIFCITGVSLALAVIKYILRIIFSFGGIKL